MHSHEMSCEDLYVQSALLRQLHDSRFDLSMPLQSVPLAHQYKPSVRFIGHGLIYGGSATVLSRVFSQGYAHLFTVIRRVLIDPATIFHLMRKVGAVTDTRYSQNRHTWVIELFNTYLGSYTLSHGMAAGEAWIFGALLPLIIASKCAAEEYHDHATRGFQTRMKNEVLVGLAITEIGWLMLHGKCAWINYGKCTDHSKCANHSRRDYARMPRRTVTSLCFSPHGSHPTITTPASLRSSGTGHQRTSSNLKENLDAANQSHVKFSGQTSKLGKGRDRLLTLPSSPWHHVPASSLLPAPGSCSVIPTMSTNWQTQRNYVISRNR